MSWIMLSEGGVYVVSHADTELRPVIEEWEKNLGDIVNSNIDLYTELFQTTFDVPEDVDDARDILVEKYGDEMYNNPEFIEELKTLKEKFDSLKTEIVTLHQVLKDLGCVITKWEDVVYDCI